MRYLLLLLIMMLTPITEATDLGQIEEDSYIIFDLNNGAYINLTGQQNFSDFNLNTSGLNISINSSYILFTSDTNKTISNITYSGDDIWRFVGDGISGLLNTTLGVNRTNTQYFITVDGATNQIQTSDASNKLQFDYSSWSTHEFEISYIYFLPPTPVANTLTVGNFFTNFTWIAGSGNITNGYNISVNGTWTNGTSQTYMNNTTNPHGWLNYTIYAYNNTGQFTLNSTPLINNTQIPNNPVVIGNISTGYNISNGSTLSIYPNSTDLDSDTPTFARIANGTFYATNGTLIWNPTQSDIGAHLFRINVSDGYGSISTQNFTVNVTQELKLLSPTNNSTLSSNVVNLIWQEYHSDTPYTYQISTDDQFINVVSSGSGSLLYSNGTYRSGNISLSYDTQYFWHIKNSSGTYTSTWEFTTSAPVVIPGRLNISVWDEQDTSLPILNYTISLYNSTSTVSKVSNSTTGWTNFSADEIASGEYLVITVPGTGYTNYYSRMVLATSPTNVTMYVPNGTSPNTINLVSLSLIDVTGLYPYKTSTISVYRGDLLQDKSYFSVDGTHSVYFLQGNNYRIQVQNKNNIFSSENFVPTTSGTSTITINNFEVNTTVLNQFEYNISYNTEEITLSWVDYLGNLSSLNFTVHMGDPMVELCQQTTSLSPGQILCGIDNTTQYHVIFSASMNDGTYRNSSFIVDYTYGKRKASTGTSLTDGSAIGTGFRWNYGNFEMPDYVYVWISFIFIMLLAGSFGGYHSGIGSIITLIIAIFLEILGLFRPLGDVDPDNLITIGITGGLLFLSIMYYLQQKDRGG